MSISFKNAPLVELIAELRWNDSAMPQAIPQPQAGQGIRIQFGGGNQEAFFERFGRGLSHLGFQSVERLVPPGFPIVNSQPVLRFKKNGSEPAPVLYQIGSGLFTANAVPPYGRWAEFRPDVEAGVSVLLATRDEGSKNTPFAAISLRYIDAFGASLTGGRDIGRFLSEVLGINLVLPSAITNHLAPGSLAKPLLQVTVPMADSLNLGLTIAEGAVNGTPAIMMDTNVSTIGMIAPDMASVMAVLERAHDVIHDIFMSITKTIENEMAPSEKG